MLVPQQIEELFTYVQSLTRHQVIQEFKTYPARFRLDFTDDFFAGLNDDKLRHIFVALVMQCDRLPEGLAAGAAARVAA